MGDFLGNADLFKICLKYAVRIEHDLHVKNDILKPKTDPVPSQQG